MTARRPSGLPDVALAATLHDASGALHDLVRRVLPRLQLVYRTVAVTVSPPTAARVTALLAESGAYAGTPAANLRGPLYRLSLRRALASGADRIHYLDLDRALHWMVRAPRELAAALRVARGHPVLLLGRTPKAHRSHHLPLYATETLANRLLGARAALSGRLDLLVPSFVLSRELTTLLLARSRSRARDASVYGEWAALLLGFTRHLAYLECRGLEWETPDRHRRAIRRAGLAAWRRRRETPAEWSLRITMAAEFVAGFERTLTRWPVTVDSVHRIPERARG